MTNTSQDPEYEGLPYNEKKVHKTHFTVTVTFRDHNDDWKKDLDWVEIRPGRWKYIPKETRRAR
jgi:hypothetical protein